MAFHFNWSPLIADTDRVRHMLTASLNKTPKPPIIVDDIIVNELNLGSTPPSLEILEVGDLAEDRFRGVFRVKYEGDAYLTLRTRVQANPLNTFLSTKSDWVNPGVGAAGSGLTIPLQITLSDIRMSGFVILVFSKQKGITLVFRNDPLESLKVSSTFDSIPFVREYLQRTIEGQLRVLFMEDLPAIIHRLSLRVFNADGAAIGEREREENRKVEQRLEESHEREASKLAQAGGEDEGLSVLGFETSGREIYADFSQKNLLRLMALTESQRTLSLFTPGMRDTVYRAWTTSMERQVQDGVAGTGVSSLHRPTLSRIQSQLNMAHGAHPAGSATLSSAASFTSETAASQATRPSLHSMASTAQTTTTSYTLSSAGGGHPRTRPRKRKNRVVNLRKNRGEGGSGEHQAGEDAVSVSSGYETASHTESAKLSSGDASTGLMMKGGTDRDASTVPTSTSSRQQMREGEVVTPHGSPKKKLGWQEREGEGGTLRASTSGRHSSHHPQRPVTPHMASTPHLPSAFADPDETPRQSMYLPPPDSRPAREKLPRMHTLPSHAPPPPQDPRSASMSPPPALPRSSSDLSIGDLVSGFPSTAGAGGNGGILEQAWMMKMAAEIAGRVAREKGVRKGEGPVWEGSGQGEEEAPPPAYVG